MVTLTTTTITMLITTVSVQIPLILRCIILEIDYIIKTLETRHYPREDEIYIVDGKMA